MYEYLSTISRIEIFKNYIRLTKALDEISLRREDLRRVKVFHYAPGFTLIFVIFQKGKKLPNLFFLTWAYTNLGSLSNTKGKILDCLELWFAEEYGSRDGRQ